MTDSLAHTVRRIANDGSVTTIAGNVGVGGDADTQGKARGDLPASM
jgi:hypothetical protein